MEVTISGEQFAGVAANYCMLQLHPEFEELFARYSNKKIARYMEFREQSPQVYAEFVRLAELYKAKGRDRLSATLIGNVLRWHTAIGEVGSDYKIRNEFLPMMARELASTRPAEFGNLFSWRGEGSTPESEG